MKKLLVLHGALGSAGQMRNLIDELSRFFKVYSLEFSGHGESAFSPEGFSIEVFANELESFIRTHQLEHINVFGYSMGGHVALKLAARRPELVGSIVTYGTKLDWSDASLSQELKMLDPQVIAAKVPKFARMLEERHRKNDWKDLLSKTAELMKLVNQGQYLAESELTSISCPVMMCIGTEDSMVTVEETRAVAEKIERGTLKILEGLKHPVEQIDLSSLSDVIDKFLDN